jgi:hypothetical protein
MSDNRMFSRREAIKFAVAATVAVFAQSQLPGAAVLPHTQPALLPARLSALLAHTESANVIGGEYLRQYPQEAHVDVLLDQIAGRMAARDVGLFSPTDQELRQQLDGVIRADFAADRIVKLRGWVLAATEARLCALAVLL